MNSLDIEYIKMKDMLLQDMEDDEFDRWLYCEDCCIQDYEILIKILEEEEMYERIIMVKQYLEDIASQGLSK